MRVRKSRRLLTPDDIRIHRIGKDLGVQTTGARRRSTAGQKERLQKGMKRNTKLHSLKIGPGKVRGRLFTASVLSSGVWGHQGRGLSPSVRGKLRLQAARINGHQKLGSVIAALDMQEYVCDPVEEAVCQHWRSVSRILARDPSRVSRTWQVLWSRLGDQRRWARVTWSRISKDYGIEAPEWNHWTIPGDASLDIRINPDLPWHTFKAEAALRGQVRKSRNRLLSQQTSCGMLEDGVDWTVPKRLVHKHKSRSDRLTGMRAVWQGAVLRGARSGTTVCPLCQKEASTKHVLRECIFWKDRQPRHWAKWEAEFPLPCL